MKTDNNNDDDDDDDDDTSKQLASFKSYGRQIKVDQSLYFAGPIGWSAGGLSSSQASIQVSIASASLLK